jgi:predicted dithiol-disulfide oxidoreductase (DUF899 family)
MNTTTLHHPVATRERFVEHSLALLAREKALTRLQDEVARERRALPWVRIDKPYVFDTVEGPRGLAELFRGRSQLLVQHFMFAPGWEGGCKSCSFMADHTDGTLAHLARRDVSFVAISRAPLADIQRFRQRMGWRFDWVSSFGTDFNHDFGVSFTAEELARGEVDYNYTRQPFPLEEAPGISAFCRDEAGQVFHTYSTYGRGVELMMGTYRLLDIAPKGRDEEALSYSMEWVRHHDRYEEAPAPIAAGSCCGGKG